MLLQISVVALLHLAAPVTAGTLSVQTVEGTAHYTFAPNKISRQELAASVSLSEYSLESFVAGSFLELCVDGQPEYLSCGNRHPTAPNFFTNATVNVTKGVNLAEKIRGMRVPPELVPVRDYRLREVSFYNAAGQAQLDYIRSADAAVLQKRVAGFDPVAVCPAEIQAVKAPLGVEERYDAAKDWHNCLNSRFRKQLGPFPTAAWKTFLTAYGIQETLALEEVE